MSTTESEVMAFKPWLSYERRWALFDSSLYMEGFDIMEHSRHTAKMMAEKILPPYFPYQIFEMEEEDYVYVGFRYQPIFFMGRWLVRDMDRNVVHYWRTETGSIEDAKCRET